MEYKTMLSRNTFRLILIGRIKICKLQTYLQKLKAAYEIFVRDCNQFGFDPSKSIM